MVEEANSGKPVKKRTIPTPRQMAAIALINQGVRPSKAMSMAGYNPGKASAPKTELLSKKGVQSMVSTMKGELLKRGLGSKFWAGKMKEWANAEETVIDREGEEHHKPDYKTQLAAYDRAKDVLGINEGGKKVTRKIELTEFLNEDFESDDFVTEPSGEGGLGVSNALESPEEEGQVG